MMKVAVLGLGIMGSGMARSLLAAGFDVAVWNRSMDKGDALERAGATVANSPADAVDGAKIVIAMLADDDVSRKVWTGENGALAVMEDGATAIESSTLSREWVCELARLAAARSIPFLEAPVTGSRDQAAQGNLRFLVGGEPEHLDAASSALNAMGSTIVHVGPTGSAAVVKLVNNFLCGVQAASLAEAVALFERTGLDPERAMSIVTDGAPASPIVKTLGRRMLDRDYIPHFLIPLMAKDLGYAAHMLQSAGITSSIAQGARQLFIDADKAGFPDRDISAVVEVLRKYNGVPGGLGKG